jgi:hypothetical protein
VIDGVSYDHMSERVSPQECENGFDSIVTAASNEIASALEWIYGGAANIPSLCLSPPCATDGVDDPPEATDARVTRLYQNRPNPFNPRTVLRFSLAGTGQAELAIYDVSGRKVRTLVEGWMDAGLHEVVWDGTDDLGHTVPAGVFWSQLTSDGFRSNKKMVVLK